MNSKFDVINIQVERKNWKFNSLKNNLVDNEKKKFVHSMKKSSFYFVPTWELEENK